MTFRHEWQLVAHKPKLTPAEALVALAIARRIPQDSVSVRIPIRTLTAESVGLNSRNTIAKAKDSLEAKGVIRIIRGKTGSRQPDRIEWVLTCPEDCKKDHALGNKRSKLHTERALEALSPNTTRSPDEHNTPTAEDALRVIKKERESLELVRKFISELENPTSAHLELLEKLDNAGEAREIETLIKAALQSADSSPHNYLKRIVTNSPLRLMPRALKAANNPQDLALKELADARRARELEHSKRLLEEAAELERLSVPPPPELRAALGLR